MLAADILSQYDFGCSLRFANFAGEEQGLHGSKHSARLSDCRDEAIQAVLNLDMIGWNTAGSLPGMDLHANRSIPGSLDIANLFADVVETYNLNLDPDIKPAGIGASDHASYWTYNIPAILVIEDMANFNPNYHNTTDRLSTLKDLPYFIAMIKASLGTMAHMSCLVEEAWGSLAGVVSDAQSGEPLPGVKILITNPEWGYTFEINSVERGYFQRTLLPGEHIIDARAPGYEPAFLSGIYISSVQQTVPRQQTGDAIRNLQLFTPHCVDMDGRTNGSGNPRGGYPCTLQEDHCAAHAATVYYSVFAAGWVNSLGSARSGSGSLF
jgi:hypothetical protein